MKLTKNFSKSEFESKDGAVMPAAVLTNIKELAKNLQVLRDHFGVKIKIISGYRSPAHNKAVNGAKKSQHMEGNASDIKVEGKTPNEVAKAIEELIAKGKMKQGGLKAYATFTHYDTRGIAARW